MTDAPPPPDSPAFSLQALLKLLGALGLLLVTIYVLKPFLEGRAEQMHADPAGKTQVESATKFGSHSDEVAQLNDQLVKAYATQNLSAEVIRYLSSEDQTSWLAVIDLIAENGVRNTIEVVFERDPYGRKVGKFDRHRFVIYPAGEKRQ